VRKRAAVLRFVDYLLQSFGKHFDQRIAEHVKLEAARVVELAFEHAQRCHGGGCQVGLMGRSNALLAVCIVQKALEALVRDDSARKSIAPESSVTALQKHIEETRQVETLGASGATQRAQTSISVSAVLGWSHEDATRACVPCISGASTPEPASANPAPEPEEEPEDEEELETGAPSEDTAEAGDEEAVFRLRDAIHAAARLIGAKMTTKQAALDALTQADVVGVLGESGVPSSLCGIALVRAAAKRLGDADAAEPVKALLREHCDKASISASTVRALSKRVDERLSVTRGSALGVFGDGIF